MPIGLYIVPYSRVTPGGALLAARQCDIYLQLTSLSGHFEQEVRGNRAFVKVNVSAANLTTLDGLYYRLPADDLRTNLSTVTALERTRLETELLDMGFTALEIAAQFVSGLGSATLGEVVRFMASHVPKPRYRSSDDTIVLDGDVRNFSRLIDLLDERVR